MAVTGKFLADFSSFYTAVQKADVALDGLETSSAAVGKKLESAANAFQGQKIIQQATIAVEAVNRIGGATALTEKEQAKLNALLTEAIAKYQALGRVAPQELTDMAAATAKVKNETAKLPSTFGSLTASLTSLAGAFGIAFSAQAVIGFAKSVFETAGTVDDLSKKIGISAEAVQRFTFAAEQSGASIDDVGTAIFKMNAKIAEGSKGTAQAFADLGLSLADIRKLKPEDAFLAITDALKAIPDPMTRARLEMELFGKSGGALGAAIEDGFRRTADAADAMSNDTIKALADAEDAWGKLATWVTIQTGTIIAASINAATQITGSWAKFREFVSNTIRTGSVGTALTIASTQQVGETAAGAAGAGAKPPTAAGAGERERLEREREAAVRKAEAAARQQEAIDQRIFAGLTQRAAMYERTEALLESSTAALQKYTAQHRQLNDVISATLPAEATEAYTGYGRSLAHVSAALAENTTRMQQQQQQLDKNHAAAARFFASLPTATQELDRLGAALVNVGGILGNQLVAQLGATLSAFARVKGAIADLRGGFDTMTSGGGLSSILGGFTSIVSGIGGIVAAAQAAIAIGRTLFGLFDRNKGRDMVVAFAESMGGFDALREKLNALGEEGERLWIKLTQGVGRNNTEAAAAAIKAIEDALGKAEAAADDAGAASEEQARATIETATEAARALEELGPKITDNEAQWAAWADVVNGAIASIASNLRSLALPTLSGEAAESLTAPAGGGTAVVQLDGRTIAEAIVPAIPGAVIRYGLA